MKFVILVWSKPQPWGHPTGDFVAENKALPQEQRERMNADFDALLTEISGSGELEGGVPLGDRRTRPRDGRRRTGDADRHPLGR